MSERFIVGDMYVDAQIDTTIVKKVAGIAKEKFAQSNSEDIFYIDFNDLKFVAIYHFGGFVIKPITKNNKHSAQNELAEVVCAMSSDDNYAACRTIFIGCNFHSCIPRMMRKTFFYCAFVDCDFTSVVLEGVKLFFTKFDGCDFYGADISRCTFDSESSVRQLRENNESVHVLQRCPTEGSFICSLAENP